MPRPSFSRRMDVMAVFLQAILVGAALAQSPAPAHRESAEGRVENVLFLHENEQQEVIGRVVAEGADGGLLLQTDEGIVWIIEGRRIVRRTPTDAPFKPVTQEQMSERLLNELPPGFAAHTTQHYVIAYNTSRVYAQWIGSLLERLYRAFTAYWQRQGEAIREPEFPLPVIVFVDRRSYDEASREDLPGGVGDILGYYSLRTNRVNMFDLTGAEAIRGQDRRRSFRDINRMLSQPAAIPLVTTVVHEATHQIAFNCGLSARYADLPLWLLEGMAMYFEAPDLTSSRGWTGIGKLNYPRLKAFRRNLPKWKEGSLERLLTDDQLFRDPQTGADAYADAWALNYYLVKYESKAYTAYVKQLAEREALLGSSPEARLEEFRKHFGDLEKLEQDFLKRMSRIE